MAEAGPHPFRDPKVEQRFAGYPAPVRARLLRLRELIFDTAAATPGVGPLEESLRWGEPAYLTSKTRSGTTVRIDAKEPESYALFVHCQTDLVATYRARDPDAFEYEGSRAIRLPTDIAPPEGPLRHCIALALTYHLDKRR